MQKVVSKWYSPRLQREVTLVRWGHFGQPLLLYPTAGGDAEEIERFHLIRALAPHIDAGKIKVYSPDSVAGRTWIDRKTTGVYRAWVQNQYDAYVYNEVVPAIRQDTRNPTVEIITSGASIGAFNAFASICRHPDVFSVAICMSGTYDLSGWMEGEHTLDFHYSSPMHFLPFLGESAQLAQLRKRMVVLGCGLGRWESPEHTWDVANLLGKLGVPNYVDIWGPGWDHDWPSWRKKLPEYVEKLVK